MGQPSMGWIFMYGPPAFDFSLTCWALRRTFAVLPYGALQIFAYRRQEIFHADDDVRFVPR